MKCRAMFTIIVIYFQTKNEDDGLISKDNAWFRSLLFEFCGLRLE